jgi:hypothetical protein
VAHQTTENILKTMLLMRKRWSRQLMACSLLDWVESDGGDWDDAAAHVRTSPQKRTSVGFIPAASFANTAGKMSDGAVPLNACATLGVARQPLVGVTEATRPGSLLVQAANHKLGTIARKHFLLGGLLLTVVNLFSFLCSLRNHCVILGSKRRTAFGLPKARS